MYYIIYITINIINWKFYIGKHTTDNLNDGYLGSGYVLKKAIKKYGKENFIRLDLEFFNSEKDVNEREKKFIDANFLLNFREHCYNVGSGGFGGDNISCHPNRDNIIKKMSNSSKEKWKNKEYHDKTTNSIGKALRSDNHRKIRSKIATNLWNTKEYRNKTTEGTKKSANLPKNKVNQSKIQKDLWKTESHKIKMMSILRSEEHRNVLSLAAHKLYKEKPEIKKIQGQTRSKTMQLPEIKEKMSKAAKLRYQNSKKMQQSLTDGRIGNKNPSWGSKWMFNIKTKDTKKVSQKDINEFLTNGWHFGRLKRTKN